VQLTVFLDFCVRLGEETRLGILEVHGYQDGDVQCWPAARHVYEVSVQDKTETR